MVLVALLMTLVGCSQQRPPSGGGVADPLQVLHDWDVARARAWAQADPVALAGLYLPGARVGRQDVAALRRYLARDLRLTDMRMQVLSARTVIRTGRRMRLIVVERFAGARAESAAGARALPAGVPVARVIDLRRPADQWLVASVRPWPLSGPR